MPRRYRLIYRTFLPLALLIFIVVTGVMVLIVREVAHPPRRDYVVTPDKYINLSVRAVKATTETWKNPDGTRAQGWLLRGAKGAPAVVFLHGYGADRSWQLNLGVKLNETTNYTILWPDFRGHGQDPPVKWTSFGTKETEDVKAAFAYLKTLTAEDKQPLVGEELGLYGDEMGAYVALVTARQHPQVRALVLDSVPTGVSDVVSAAVGKYTGADNAVTEFLMSLGARAYYLGQYHSEPLCETAKALPETRVLLLTGANVSRFHDSTVTLSRCFPNPNNIEFKSDLPLTGAETVSATGEQAEAYDRLVINFFDRTLGAADGKLRGAPAKPKK